MGKRSKQLRLQQSRLDTTAPVLVTPDLEALSLAGSFQSANTSSRDRGYVYVPTLDTKKEVDEYSRIELLKRARFIYNSGGGLIQRGVDGVARMICGTGMLPHPLTQNRDWNRRRRALYMQRCGNAGVYDLSRRRNVFQAQRAIVGNAMIKDGDGAVALALEEETGRLRRRFYEAHQIGTGSTRVDPVSGWSDGVLLDRHDAALAYRILGRDRLDREIYADVPAENILFVANAQRFGQVRGLTRFAPVLNKVLDRGEVMAAITRNIKITKQVAYAIEQQLVQGSSTPGGSNTTLPVRPSRYIQTNDGKTLTLEKFLGGGEALPLKPGQSFKVIESANPHPNEVGHLKELIRDIAWAIKYSPDILWNIIDLGGANMRFVQADLAQQIEVEQDDLVDMYLGPDYVADTWDCIRNGDIEEIKGWELHAWTAPARLTVDFGRDGRLYIEELKRGLRTMKSMYGMRGEEWMIEVDQYLDEREYIKAGLESRKLTWEEAYPEVRQQTIGATTNSNGDNVATTEDIQQLSDKIDEFAHAIQFAREPKS